MSAAVAFLIGYFVAMLGIGFWAARRTGASDEEYLLGGRRLGPAVTALRLQSTSMSGYMFAGAGALGYASGYYGMWYALGDLGGGLLNLSVLGKRMRTLSHKLGSISSIEYLGDRYDSQLVRRIGAVLAVAALFLYLLGQFIAGGAGLAAVAGLPFNAALLIAVGVIVAYTFLGGYLAVAYTDFVQALVMVVGMAWILIATVRAVGGLSAGHAGIAELNPNLLTMFGADLEYRSQWGTILGALLIFSIGYMGWPHVVVSHMAMKNPAVTRKASVYSVLFNLVFVPAPYLVGLFALLLVPNLADPETAIFAVAQKVLPGCAVGIVMAAVMAAIMSTADALLLQASTIVARDLLPCGGAARWTVLVLATAGIAVALWQPPTVLSLITFAATVLGSAFAPSYICAVWWPKANKAGALTSMLTGAVVSVGWKALGLDAATGWDAMVAGIGSSTLAMVVGTLTTQRRYPVPARIQAALREI